MGYGVWCTVYSVQCTVYSVQCTVYEITLPALWESFLSFQPSVRLNPLPEFLCRLYRLP
jgi:hypothetical protein